MTDLPVSSLPPNSALPAMPLPALPPISSPVPGPSSLSPMPPSVGSKRATPGTPDLTDAGPPKRKRVRKSVATGGTPGEPSAGPGKSWRKGLKGNLAGVGLEAALAAGTVREVSTPVATPAVAAPPAPPPVPLPPLIPFHPPPRVASNLVGVPPKLATQFLPVQKLELGTPRPRRWARAKMEFRNITGGTIVLSSWQGDTSSAYSEQLGRVSVDELGSPVPGARTPSSHTASSITRPALARYAPPGLPAAAASSVGGPSAAPLAPSPASTTPASTPAPQPAVVAQTLAPPSDPGSQPLSISPSSAPSATATISVSPLAPPTFPPLPALE
ncbi:uncharacterized protein JCM15063_001091 [Sporobolomyces koalae]|uniref:uncharacterized protein n=1 Tax=Sporobolomyces koalae TaxID=500713 RepID=UPI00317E9903